VGAKSSGLHCRHGPVDVLIAVCFGIGFLTLLAIAWMGRRRFQESRRLTRALAGLVAQETEKIRRLVR
jgi:hypothetical protein